MESRVGPSAWRRAWTAFCAPLPSATIVMTAPTPMMMPSIVRNDRSLLARIAWSATWKISPRSMLGPGRRSLRPRRCGRLLLLNAGQAAASDVAHALLHVALRIEQRRARQHEHGILLGQPAHDLDVVEIGEPGADLHWSRLAVLEREDDVARRLARVATEAAAAAAGTTATAASALHHGPHGGHRVLLRWGQLLTRHPLLEGRPDLRFRYAGRKLNRPPVGHGHRVATAGGSGGVVLDRRVAACGAST